MDRVGLRDKIAASKRKGMWMGGLVPLGYDAVDRKLVVNEAEARTVRHIYARYLALGSIRQLKAELDRDGIVSKTRVSSAGKQIGGTILSRGALVLILKNPLYIGEVHHRGERFPGQHEAIIERETWNAVQESLAFRRVERRAGTNARDLSPLAGMLFDDQGRPLSPSHASKGPARVRYRYYISHGLSAGLAENHRDGWRLPAEPVERTVRNALSSFLQKQTAVHEILEPSGSAAEHQQCLAGVEALRRDVETSHAATLRHLLTTLAARIEIGADSVAISVSRTALQRQIGVVVGASSTDEPLVFRQPLALRKRGVETKLVLGDSISPERDQALVKLIADARSWAKRLVDGELSSVRALARELRLEHRHVARALPLAYLAPDIVEEILDGRQPVTLTVTGLKRLPALPPRWDEQPETLGFPRKA